MNSLIQTAIEQGLIFGVLAMGVTITFKILNFADMSAEGTFPMGAFIFARFILAGMSPIVSTLLAFFIGAFAGIITYVLHVKMKITALLSGILTMTLLYSVNLRINNKSNVGLFNYDSIFDNMEVIVVLIIIVAILKILMDLFLKTEMGYLLVATGDNETLVKSLGENSDKYKLLGLMLSNGLVSLSGAMMAQYQGFADTNMATGIVVIALASVIIGDTIFKNSKKLKRTTRAIMGAIIYKIIGAVAIDLGLSPQDLKGISAIIVIAFLGYNNLSLSIPVFKNLKIRRAKEVS